MKFSVCAADCMLSQDSPFSLRAKSFASCAEKAAMWGYDGIELQIQDPREYDGRELKKTLDAYGLGASAVTTGLAYTMEGLSMTHPDAGVRRAAVERLKRDLDLARDLDSQILIGYMRGRKSPGMSDEEFEDILTDSLGQVIEYGAQIQTPTVVEQINRNDGDVFNSTERTMQFLEKFHSDWLLYNADTYHMITEDPDIEAAILRALPKLVLFHVSDAGRMLPDDQHFDFRLAADVLNRVGYSRWVTIECRPLPDSATVTRQGIAYLKKIFGREAEVA